MAVCKVCHVLIEPSDSIIKCSACGEWVHRQCRGDFSLCEICTENQTQPAQAINGQKENPLCK